MTQQRNNHYYPGPDLGIAFCNVTGDQEHHVTNGALWLDRHYPGWVERINFEQGAQENLSILEMATEQPFDTIINLSVESRRWAHEYGFAFDRYFEHRLESCWKNAVALRNGALDRAVASLRRQGKTVSPFNVMLHLRHAQHYDISLTEIKSLYSLIAIEDREQRNERLRALGARKGITVTVTDRDIHLNTTGHGPLAICEADEEGYDAAERIIG